MRNWVKRAVLTRIICALAVFMLGFSAHASTIPNLEPYGVDYRLPDGTYASLCMPSEEKGAPHNSGNHCDSCVISTGHLFTPPQAFVAQLPVFQRGNAVLLIAAKANIKRIVSHYGQSRAPPLNG